MIFKLDEELLISKDEADKFKYDLTNNEKLDYIKDFIKKLPNYNNIKQAEFPISQSILKNGFDTDDNKFLEYIQKIKTWTIDEKNASLINTLMDNKSIDPSDRWLYFPSLYKESPDDISYKIKAMAYANDSNLQKNSNRQITIGYLLNKSGQVQSAEEIKNLLSKITTNNNSSFTIQDAFQRIFKNIKDFSNEQNIRQIKNAIKKELKEEGKLDTIISKKIDTLNLSNILNLPTTYLTLKSASKSVLNYIQDGYKTREKDKSEDMTGADIIKSILKPDYKKKDLFNYILTLSKKDNELKAKYTDTSIINYLNSSKGLSDLNSLLRKSYSQSALGSDISKQDLLDNDIKSIILKNIKEEDKAGENKYSGSNLIKNALGITDKWTSKDLLDYIKEISGNNSITNIKIEQYYDSPEGKNNLYKILRTDFTDDNVLDDIKPIDELNNALKQWVDKAPDIRKRT